MSVEYTLSADKSKSERYKHDVTLAVAIYQRVFPENEGVIHLDLKLDTNETNDD